MRVALVRGARAARRLGVGGLERRQRERSRQRDDALEGDSLAGPGRRAAGPAGAVAFRPWRPTDEQTSSRRSSPAPAASDYERYLRTDELLALQKGAGRVGASRRAALPDRAPVVGALAQARVGRGGGGDAPRRGARPRRGAAAAAPRERALAYVERLPRAPRADVAVGVPGGAARARPRLRLRLARLPRDPPRLAAALGRVRRAAPRARAVAPRGLHARPRARGSVPARRGADRLGRAASASGASGT